MLGLIQVARKLQSVTIEPLIARMRRNLPINQDFDFPASLLLQILLVILFILAGFLAIFLSVDDTYMAASTKSIFGPFIVVLICIFGYTLYSLVQGNYRRARLITAWTVAFGCLFPAPVTGGFPNSEAAPILIVLPAIFFCLYGGRAGALAVGLVVVSCLLQLFVSHGLGIPLPDYSSKSSTTLNHAMTLTTAFSIVVLAFTVYSRANVRLRVQRDAERAHLAALANEDPLTGLSNARYLHQRLDQACARVDRHGGQLAMLYLDFNGFKKINDDFGHQIGDKVLCKIGSRLRHAIRREDIVARLGGDEFAILVEFIKDEHEIAQLVERVHHLISMPVETEDSEHTITASVGRVIYPGEVAQKHLIIEYADRAMYRAKRLVRTQATLALDT